MTQRVLLAEDDPDTSRALRELLEGGGYEVVETDSAESAWRHYKKDDFGIVLSDLHMPGMSGLDLIRKIREHGDRGYTYVILISREDELPGLDELMSSGPDDFIAKPVAADALFARLKVAARIAQMQTDLVSDRKTIEIAYRQLEEIHQEIQHQLKAAARVQRALLPAGGLSIPGLRFAWRLTPCVELAGDLFNCIRIDDEHAAFYILDVSGHGVASALLSVQISRVLSPLLSDSGVLKQRQAQPPWYRLSEPLEVMHQLNSVFQANPEMSQYFTMVYGLLNTKTGKVRLSTAGHPPPIVSNADDGARVISCSGNPVGLLEKAQFGTHETVLQQGDRLWLYSDGIVEATDRRGRTFGWERLRDRIARSHRTPLEDAMDAVMEEAGRWNKRPAPEDDCSLLALELASTKS